MAKKRIELEPCYCCGGRNFKIQNFPENDATAPVMVICKDCNNATQLETEAIREIINGRKNNME